MRPAGPPRPLDRSLPHGRRLGQDRQPLVDQSYQWRRERLDGLDLDSRAPRLRVPANYLDVQPHQLLQVARDHGLEGILTKRLNSRYEPGRRSPAWVKTALLTTQW